MYIFPDKNNSLINQELNLRLSQLTAQGLIKSETEYKQIITDMINTINSNINRVTITDKYVVKPDDLVASAQLNALFTDLQSDMRILHQEVDDINRVVDLTYQRNKLFFRRVKNRLAAIWKEIQRFREQSFNIEGSAYTFFESFSEDSEMYLTGLSIDKKTGTLTLEPGYINSFSDSADVANVVMTLYPEANKDGGLYNTTNVNNTFEYNFTQGDRSILKNGLWKIQMLTADVPEIVMDVFNSGVRQTYRGIIAQVDITFTSEKLINQLDIDPYGDFKTNILSLNYLPTADSTEWLNVIDDSGNVVTGGDTDWIVLRNFKPFSAKTLRITFYQSNYQVISRLLNKVSDMVNSMVKALVENRFSKINYQYNGPDQFPRFNTFEDGDIYDEVMEIIENGGNITTLESQITNLLIPQPIGIQADITNWRLFNMGAWEIDPQNIGYKPQAIGIYISHDPQDHMSGFMTNNGVPKYARLYTKQTEDATTSIVWSLLADVDGINYVEIPIMPNDDMFRNEPTVQATLPALKSAQSTRNIITYPNLTKVIKLDFPVHPAYQDEIVLLENGIEITVNDSQYFEFYNSTELYIATADFTGGNVYTIKYVPAVIDTVKVWTITPDKPAANGYIDFGSMCCFANEMAADNMIQMISQYKYIMTSKPSYVSMAENYTKSFQLCTRKEFDEWFNNGTVNTFIDESVDNDDDHTNQVAWFISGNHNFIYHSDITKNTWLFRSNVPSPFSDNNSDYYTWRSKMSAVPTIKVTRNLY